MGNPKIIRDVRDRALRLAGRPPVKSMREKLLDLIRGVTKAASRFLGRRRVKARPRRHVAMLAAGALPGAATVAARMIVARRVKAHADDAEAPTHEPDHETTLNENSVFPTAVHH
jgi:hypothetical protein